MPTKYRVSVYLTEIDKEQANELRLRLGRVIKGAGKATLNDLMRRVYHGERILVYETNDDKDAQSIATDLESGGATVAIEGLREEEPLF